MNRTTQLTESDNGFLDKVLAISSHYELDFREEGVFTVAVAMLTDGYLLNHAYDGTDHYLPISFGDLSWIEIERVLCAVDDVCKLGRCRLYWSYDGERWCVGIVSSKGLIRASLVA